MANANAASVEVVLRRAGRSAVALSVNDAGVGSDPTVRTADGHIGLIVLGGIVADAGKRSPSPARPAREQP